MNLTDEQIRAAIAQQAAGWFIENQDGPLEEAERVAFIRWLKTSPVHVEEYLGMARIARELPIATNGPGISIDELLAQESADKSDTVVAFDPTAARREQRVRRRERLPGWAMAAGLALMAVSAVWWTRDGERFGLPRTYETVHGVQGAWRLPDGSVLHLNTDTAATVHYSKQERVVDLQHGEAFIQIARDQARQFRVAVGRTDLWAVGTQFDVYARAQTTVLTVLEGTVLAADQHVEAGHQLRIQPGVTPGPAMAVDTSRAIAWLQQRIVFEHQPLGEVADEFNRYGKVPVVIDDLELRALRLSGIFNAYDTDSFATFLGTLDGVGVEKTATRIRVYKVSAPTRERKPVAGESG